MRGMQGLWYSALSRKNSMSDIEISLSISMTKFIILPSTGNNIVSFELLVKLFEINIDSPPTPIYERVKAIKIPEIQRIISNIQAKELFI